MQVWKLFSAILSVLALTALAGCAGNSMNQNVPQMGNVFTLGTDAQPAFPSVVSFQVMITGITVNNSGGSLPVLQNALTIDFARPFNLRVSVSSW